MNKYGRVRVDGNACAIEKKGPSSKYADIRKKKTYLTRKLMVDKVPRCSRGFNGIWISNGSPKQSLSNISANATNKKKFN